MTNLPSWVEFQDRVVGDRLELLKAIARAIVAAQPDEALGVDIDAVLALRPVVAGPGRRPRT